MGPRARSWPHPAVRATPGESGPLQRPLSAPRTPGRALRRGEAYQRRREPSRAWNGAAVLTLLPMAVSLYLSFTDYDMF
ncbi:hypothetical protein AB0D24_41135, partial [Streptomyces javensis]